MFLFFFNDPATTEIYTLSLHDALPISLRGNVAPAAEHVDDFVLGFPHQRGDRKSTRPNSSHRCISYAVFCLKKKKIENEAEIGQEVRRGALADIAEHLTACKLGVSSAT